VKATNKLLAISASILLVLSLSGCGGPSSLAGQWRADDGTGVKLIDSNGACSGMFYVGPGDPLDIGGPMSCSLSSKKGSDGRYSLVVTQSMNQQTLKVAFDGNDEATVYGSSGDRLLSMTRQ
jgi:hypothetical protein